MPTYFQTVAALSARDFSKTDETVQGRVLKLHPDGPYLCEVDRTVPGIIPPDVPFESTEDAIAALLQFWGNCEEALRREKHPGWIDVHYNTAPDGFLIRTTSTDVMV